MQDIHMTLTNKELLFIGTSVAAVVVAFVYFKYYAPSNKCNIQNFTYNPSVINTENDNFNPANIKYMTTPLLETKGVGIPYQQTMIANYPMTLTRQELEDRVALDGFGMGPGMVEGYRFRGNLNL